MASVGKLDDANACAVIRSSARLYEPDRYITALLAPSAARDDLITLAAYLGEVRRIPLIASDATLGEIRLQWWRDNLQAGAQGGVTGNPIADDMVRVIARNSLALDLVFEPLEAISAELEGEPFAGGDAWLSYLDRSEVSAGRLVSQCLGQEHGAPAFDQQLRYARAISIIRLALRLPELLAKGRWPVAGGATAPDDPRGRMEGEAREIVRRASDELCGQAFEHLLAARKQYPEISAHSLLAILPAALVAPYAKAIRQPGRDALREPAQIAPLTRILRLWRASWLKRV